MDEAFDFGFDLTTLILRELSQRRPILIPHGEPEWSEAIAGDAEFRPQRYATCVGRSKNGRVIV